ncbi:amino acid adenylation domain-containing protein [Lusitaniella coriacea LEGE 07167]
MTEIDRRIAKLSPAKRALLEQKLKQKAGKKKESQRIPKRSLEDAALLSSAQVRMWFLAQLEQENPAYNRPSNIRLKGALNVAVLERSLQEIIRRHDVLRTFFSFNSGKPIQTVVPEIELSLPLINLSDFSEPKEELERLAKEEAQRPFDVSKLPLFRATLVRFRDEEHFLLLTFHHIIFDGWSMGVFLQELAALYNASSQNLSSPLLELPIQYGDFAVWQQQRLQGEHLQSQLKYWKRQLGGQLPVLELPTDRPRESAKTFRGAKHVAVFPKALSTALKALSQREGVTLFMTLLAAFQGLLHRYTRQEDVIVGTPIAGRDRAELEPLIGVFINTLVLRGDLSGNPTFRDFLQQMREVALGAYKNQELPFEKVVEVLQPERNLRRNSIFQVLFQLRNIPSERIKIDGLSFEEVKFERGTAALDLALDVVDKPGGLACTFVYNCDLFEAETVERMAGHFQTFLESVVANPQQNISEISLWGSEDRQMQLQQKQISCVLIGHESFLIPCAESLVARSHRICGIVSEGSAIANWARERQIPFIPSVKELSKVLQAQPFDYLFSIHNLEILSPAILELPREFAINCHDALLPKYGGINAPSWAILHKEKVHGVTWHVMRERVDAGDILLQVPIDVSDKETAFTLNNKCYGAAIESFEQLINDLVNKKLSRRAQESVEKSYFLSSKKPCPGCLLTWDRSALKIDAFCRALDFKSYPNLLGLPKLKIGSDFVIVSQVEILDRPSDSLPGTIIAIETNHLQVATTSSNIAICKLQTIEGQSLSILEFVTRYRLQIGDSFENINPKLAKQIQTLESRRVKHETFWVKRLSTLQPIALPYRKKIQSTQSQQVQGIDWQIPQEVTAFLKNRSERWMQGNFLFAAFAAYLARINQSDCFDLGLRTDTEQIPGEELDVFFVSTVPCRIEIDVSQSFEEVFSVIRAQVELTERHELYPRDIVLRYPELQAIRGLENEGHFPIQVERVARQDAIRANYCNELSLIIPEEGEKCCWLYDREVWDDEDIARLLAQFTIFIRGAIADIQCPVALLPLLSERDRNIVLSKWNTPQTHNISLCIHPLFEAQVEKTPDAIAVQWENQSLTYQELNEKANQLARYLQELGVQPEVLVGICVERSLDLLVGILGILKAGGAYVPLDPAYPQTRLDYMVTDAEIGILVAQDKFVSLFSDRASHTICLDSDWEKIATEETGNIESAVESDNLAYVIYTSGSTGNPKGVAIAHRSLVHFTRAAIAEYEITSRDRILQFSSISFDAAVEEIYPCLTTGATLVLRTEEMLRSIPVFLQQCQEWEITLLDLPTAYWHQIVTELAENRSSLPESLRLVLIGGERAIPERVQTWQKLVGDSPQLMNTYGPTETTVVATAYKIPASTEIKQEVPIGRAIANVQTYILDANLQPVPIGIPGELHIGGMGLARGYLNRPELTAERFIQLSVNSHQSSVSREQDISASPRPQTPPAPPASSAPDSPRHPVTPSPSQENKPLRLYKTGDLARYLPDGNIEFLGRIDRQVKIRGFRVELGEIEAILCEYSSVQEAVVIAAEEASGTQRLVGYIVSEERQEPEISELRDFVLEKLPDYMIPAAFVLLDSLPLTPSGKIDRRALPEPDLDEAFSAQFIAPRNEIETEIAGIWANVLGRDRVGVCDNFFELGGHSLVAIQVIARIQDAFFIDLPLRTLFESPTVEGLSEVVEQRQIFSTDAEIEPDLRAAIPQPHYDLVTDVVASWVERTPERVAISQGDCTRSYSELSHSARALARVLLDLGLQQGDVVAVQGEKSFGFIASLLAVFLGGGVLLTLDSNLPESRQQLMRKSANVKFDLFVGGENNEQSLNGIAVHPDTGEAIDVEPSVIDLPQLHPNDPAYIFFTSGTTGVPKGVLGCHKGLAHFLHWQRETFNIKPRDRAAQFTGFSFDVLLRDVFLPLTSGATLCIPPKDFDLSAASVLPWLEREKISLLHTVPTLAQSWLGDGSANLSALRWIFFAGEPLTDALVNRWRKTFPNSGQIVNFYGPTETTLAKFFYIVPEPPSPGVQPLGLPLPQTQALIWDENQQLCGKGEAGEIVLRTPFRSLGYVNAPEETQKRFIKNPYRNDAGDLLYRTGDRGRYRQDGLLEILGRIDDQIKIRGIRIEPQEIATVLNQHSAIAQTVILAREDEPGNKRLVAYCVANAQLTPRELRHFLQGQLPEYMIPVAFVLLEALPLTPNGKVDRNALPVPNSSHLLQSENFVAPRNETEQTIAAIWNQILGVNAGIFDDFFELGGHSLLATQVIARVREAFAIDLPLRRLFEFPTIAGLSEAVGNATPNTLKTLSPIDRADTIPLSFAQQRLWFLDQLEGNTAAYNIPMVLRLKGVLAVDALEKAVNAIAQRHDGLRASFSTRDGFPIQRLRPSLDLTLTTLDWRDIPEEEQAERVQQFAIEERAKPFDLERDPLLRVTLLRLKERDRVLLLTVHHIVSDGWSMRIIARELAEFYTAFLEEKEPNLPELSVQYPDFARWQRQWLQGEVLGTQLQYWKEQLTGAPPLLDLPTDRTRPEVQTFSGGTRSRKLSPTLTQSLKTFSQREGATLFMTLLAAFKLLLSRLAGTEDVVIGTPVAGRTRREFEQLIGFFINTVVLRVRCQGNPTFRDFLHHVRTVALGAYEYQEMPFEKLVEELQPERDRSYNPLFQVWFNMLNLSENRAEFSGLEVEPLARSAAPSKFDLTLYAKETPQGIRLDAVYNANLFDGERMEEMLAQFEHLLAQIVETPTERIDRFSLVSPRSLLPNPQTPLASNPQEPVHRRFSQQAQCLPEQIAVTDAQTTWTYGELNRRANQLANYLRAQGVQKQDVVAIYGDRAASLVLAILSVLKAGAVFTLLDPAYPPSRLLHCVQSANPRAWLQVKTDPLPPELEEFAQSCCINLQIMPDLTLEDVPADDPGIKIDSGDLAYIPFTSGSTGKPKGILSPHAALSHFLHWHSQTFEFSESDRFSLISGLSHDILMRDIFTPLWVGGTLCIPDTNAMEIPGQLGRWMVENEVSVAHLSPAMGQFLQATPVPCSALRWVFFGSDVLTQKEIKSIREIAPNTKLANFYGATETPQAMGYFPITDCERERIPIGRGIDDVQLLVLNAQQQLAGVGEVGEIYIRTPYLAKGYLGDAELTKERFLQLSVEKNSEQSSPRLPVSPSPRPLSASPHPRVSASPSHPVSPSPRQEQQTTQCYKTGDFGRYLPDGNVEFIGRRDDLVKIRGFRIELGEVKSAIAQHPKIQDAVVLVREGSLIAYIVPQKETPTPAQLRHFLSQKLPHYSIPSFFIAIDSIPLTPNGKIDRQVLLKHEVTIEKNEPEKVQPQNELQRQLVEIWERVLGVRPVGIRDNFFDLGGHSLLAIQLFGEMQKVVGTDIPIAAIFQAPTIEQLADILRQKAGLQSWISLVPVQPNGSKPPFFFHGGAADAMTWAGFGRNLPPDQPFYGLQNPELDGKHEPLSSVEEMAAHCLREIQTLQPHGPYYIGGHCFGGTVAFEMAQQLRDRGETVALLAVVDGYPPKPVLKDTLFLRAKSFLNRWDFLLYKTYYYHSDALKKQSAIGKLIYIGNLLKEKVDAKHKKRSPSQPTQSQKNDRAATSSETFIPYEVRYQQAEKTNRSAKKKYRAKIYQGKIALFRAKKQKLEWYFGSKLGWEEFTDREIECHEIPGLFGNLFNQSSLPLLVKEVKMCLEKTQDKM